MNTKIQGGLPWHIVEKAIEKEIAWLKNVIPVRKTTSANPLLDERQPDNSQGEYYYRKIAILIITGKIKAKEINAKGISDLWGGLTEKIPTHETNKHGGEWHRRMMDIIEHHFKNQGCEVTIEPHLNNGRADLGVFQKYKKDLYIEIDTTSIYKLWVNLLTIKDRVFIIVPSEKSIIEFET